MRKTAATKRKRAPSKSATKGPPCLTVPVSTLVKLIDVLLISASDDPTRPHLTCIGFEPEGDGKVCGFSTDGNRLTSMVCHGSVTEPFLLSAADAKWIRSAVRLMSPTLVEIALGARSMSVDGDTLRISVTAVDEAPVPWRKVVPPLRADEKPSDNPVDGARMFGIHPMYIADAAKQVAIFSGRKLTRRLSMAMKVQTPPGKLDPIRIDAGSANDGTVTIVIMPVRLS